MQGSLDHPPITITVPKTKIIIGLMVSGVAAIATLFVPQVPTVIEFSAWTFSFLFAGCLAISPRLIISQQGLMHGSLLTTKSWAWADFDGFEVFQMPVLQILSPGCRFSEAYIHRVQPIPDPLTDVSHGVIGLFWEVPAPELVQLLDQARRRWSPPKSADDRLISDP